MWGPHPLLLGPGRNPSRLLSHQALSEPQVTGWAGAETTLVAGRGLLGGGEERVQGISHLHTRMALRSRWGCYSAFTEAPLSLPPPWLHKNGLLSEGLKHLAQITGLRSPQQPWVFLYHSCWSLTQLAPKGRVCHQENSTDKNAGSASAVRLESNNFKIPPRTYTLPKSLGHIANSTCGLSQHGGPSCAELTSRRATRYHSPTPPQPLLPRTEGGRYRPQHADLRRLSLWAPTLQGPHCIVGEKQGTYLGEGLGAPGWGHTWGGVGSNRVRTHLGKAAWSETPGLCLITQ